VLSVFSSSFEVVKEGRILYKIKHLQLQIVSVFYFTPGFRQVLDKNGMFWAEKTGWKYSSPCKSII